MMKKITLFLFACVAMFATCFAQNGNAIAMIGAYKDYADLKENGDDDEKAAAKWFVDNGVGQYYGVEELYNGTVDLTKLAAMWIMIDREGASSVDDFMKNYTGGNYGFNNTTVKTKIAQFLKDGGNLLLTNHANILLKEIGRYEKYPEVVGFGTGGNNNDVWDAGVVYGTWSTESVAFDYSTDPLFANIEIVPASRPCGREYKVFHLLSEGWKEDHNCFWFFDLPENNDNGDPTKFSKLYSLYGVTLLAMWPHIEDYCGGAIARWDPKDDFKGSCITIGFAAYEWNMNVGTNSYQANIEQLTLNAIRELAPNFSGVEAAEVADDEVVSTTYYNIQGIEVMKPEQNGVYVVRNAHRSGRVTTGKVFFNK